MAEFRVSSSLIGKAVDDLPDSGGLLVRDRAQAAGHSLDELAPQWGEQVVGAIATVAQAVRYRTPPADRFTVIENGTFTEEVARCIELHTCYIGADRQPMRDLAQELLEHMRADGTPPFHPEGPVTRMELSGDTLVAHVRPYVPIKPDPNWVRSKQIE